MSSKMGARFKTLFSCTSGKRLRKHKRYVLFFSLFQNASAVVGSISGNSSFVFCFLSSNEGGQFWPFKKAIDRWSLSHLLVMFFYNCAQHLLHIYREFTHLLRCFSGTKISLFYKPECVLLSFQGKTCHKQYDQNSLLGAKELSVTEFFYFFHGLADIANIIYKQAPVLGNGEVIWLPGNLGIPRKFPLPDRSLSGRYSWGVAFHDRKMFICLQKT